MDWTSKVVKTLQRYLDINYNYIPKIVVAGNDMMTKFHPLLLVF